MPLLVRRVATSVGLPVRTPTPLRVRRSKLVQAGEVERSAELARRLQGPSARLLVVLDADDDCPAQLAASLLARASAAANDLRQAVVVANRELEAWFLAGVESLRAQRGLRADADAPADVEGPRDAKGRLAALMSRPYSDVTDPPAFAALLDLDLARRRAPSFDKFVRDVQRLLADSPVP